MTVSRSQWLHSPLYDLFFFSSLWMTPLALIVYGAAASRYALAPAVVFFVYHLFLRLPHFVCTMKVTIGIRQNRRYYLEHWGEFIAVPAIIMIVYFGVASAALDGHPVKLLLTGIALAWGGQHIAMQNFGILNLYRQRNGGPRDAMGSAIERSVIYLASGFFVFQQVANFSVGVLAAPRMLLDLSSIIFPAVYALSAVYLVRTFVVRKRYRVSGPALLYFATAIFVMTPFRAYDRIGPYTFFFVFNMQHCLAYIGLTYMMEANGRSSPQKTASFWRFIRPVLLFSAGLVAISLLYISMRRGSVSFKLDGAALVALMGFFVVHYYVESRIWRLSVPHHRNIILPLLKPPGRPAVAP